MKTRKFSFFLYCFGLALLTGFSSDISIEDLSKKDKKAIVKDYGKTIRSKTKHAERHRGLVAKWKKKDLLDYLIRFYESDIENPVRIDSFQVPHLHYGLGYAYLSSVDGVSNGRDFLILAIRRCEVNNFTVSTQQNKINIPKAIIMAGGKGQRLRPITKIIPKPLAKFKKACHP